MLRQEKGREPKTEKLPENKGKPAKKEGKKTDINSKNNKHAYRISVHEVKV